MSRTAKGYTTYAIWNACGRPDGWMVWLPVVQVRSIWWIGRGWVPAEEIMEEPYE